MRLISNQGDDHTVEIEKEHDEMEAELDEWFLMREWATTPNNNYASEKITDLLVNVQLSEDLSRIQKMLVIVDPR
jgi:hypothetical protein